MLFNSRLTALMLALAIALASTAILALVTPVSGISLLVTGLLIFSVSGISIYLTLNYFILNEIKKIHKMLDRLRKGDFDFGKNIIDDRGNILKKLGSEIFTYANIQHREISELRKTETYRREFLADVSHELKTPLFAAQGFVHTLLDGAVKDKSVRIKFLKKAAKSLAGLDKLVQDLMIISQMEAGTLKMRYSNFNMYQLVEEVFEQFEGKADKKELSLRFSENSSKEAMVYADRERIYQVMINLVSNGILYSNEKGGMVMVSIILSNNQVKIEVSDDGIGIPQEDFNRIFERFYRVEKSRSKDKGGTGLGLAIVKHILEAHNQKVHVSSVVGKGSIFSFSLQVSSQLLRALS